MYILRCIVRDFLQGAVSVDEQTLRSLKYHKSFLTKFAFYGGVKKEQLAKKSCPIYAIVQLVAHKPDGTVSAK